MTSLAAACSADVDPGANLALGQEVLKAISPNGGGGFTVTEMLPGWKKKPLRRGSSGFGGKGHFLRGTHRASFADGRCRVQRPYCA